MIEATVVKFCTDVILSLGSHDLNFREINDNISKMMQDRDIVNLLQLKTKGKLCMVYWMAQVPMTSS